MASAPRLEGVYAALPTPFDETGRIDDKALDHLVDYLCSRDLAGLALLTEAAEDALLSSEERKSLVAAISGRVKGRKPFLVSVSAPATREATEFVKLAQGHGAQAAVLAPHRLPGIGYRELYRHLEAISASTELPIMFDVRAGNAVDVLSPEEVGTLAKHAKLTGVFAPDAGTEAIEVWAKRMKKRAGAVMTGASISFWAASEAGATGSICGIAVIASDHAPKLFDAVKRQDEAFVARMERDLLPALELLGPVEATETKDPLKRVAARIAQRPLESSRLAPIVPAALIKEALRLQGHPVKARVRSPYEPATPELVEKLRTVLKVSGLMS